MSRKPVFTTSDLQAMCDSYEAGTESLGTLAGKYHTCKSTVKSILNTYGVEIRRPTNLGQKMQNVHRKHCDDMGRKCVMFDMGECDACHARMQEGYAKCESMADLCYSVSILWMP